jgi:hypothetical protein
MKEIRKQKKKKRKKNRNGPWNPFNPEQKQARGPPIHNQTGIPLSLFLSLTPGTRLSDFSSPAITPSLSWKWPELVPPVISRSNGHQDPAYK